MTDKRIEVAKLNQRIEGIEACPWGVYTGENINPWNDPEILKTWVGVFDKDAWMMVEQEELIGPYFKIEDESPYSAVKILARLGYQLIWNTHKDAWYYISKRCQSAYEYYVSKSLDDTLEKYGEKCFNDYTGSQIVLAHNLAISMLDPVEVAKVLKEIKDGK